MGLAAAVWAAVLFLGSLAAAQVPCPLTECKASFDNAMGGPIDCCRYAYPAPGATCQWGGTPVSFTFISTCSTRGKTFQILRQGNSQGGPVPDCRCRDPYVAPFPWTEVSGYDRFFDSDIRGDLGCDGKPTCKVCGPVSMVADKCKQLRCAAFTHDGFCGYLKASTGRTPRTAFSAYVVKRPVFNPVPVSGFTLFRNTESRGNDLPCDGKPTCKRCGTVTAMAETCKRLGCASFTYDGTCAMFFRGTRQFTRDGVAMYVPVPPVVLPGVPAGPPPKLQGFSAISNQDIVGRDIPCDGKPTCRVCGSLETIADRCDAGFKSTKCRAFIWDGRCGMLKSETFPSTWKTGVVKYSRR